MENVSVEGIILPNKALTNIELQDAARKLRIPHFRGMFMRNTLSDIPRKNECGICNLDDTNGTGTHWVTWYKRGQNTFYFYSYVIQPPTELVKYTQSNVYYNTEKIQSNDQVVCGHLCLYIFNNQ